MNIEEAVNVFKTAILKPVENGNKYTPTNGVTNEDRRKFFNNYNEQLAEKLITIKTEK